MKKVLIINTLGLNYEGITSVIYNYITNIDREDLNIDFIGYNTIHPNLKKQFNQIGNIKITPRRKSDFIKYVKELNKILIEQYDVVHIHGNSGTMLIETILAKVRGVKNIIVHCHNTTCKYPILNKILVPIMKKTANYCISCSTAAGKWLYGNSKYIVLNNAIDLKRFTFNPEERVCCREEFGLKDEFVIGHMGHFREQKNHTFLIDVFAELHKKISNCKLLLISDGPKMEEITKKVNNLGLEEHVIFTGRRSDTERLYQAMDLFMLPSLWEGLPVVMLEAQAESLPLLVSDNITIDAKCTERTYYKSLNDSPESWAQMIVYLKEKKYDRTDEMENGIRERGFDIKTEADKLKNIYLN